MPAAAFQDAQPMKTLAAGLAALLGAVALAQKPAQQPAVLRFRVLGLDGKALTNTELQAMFVGAYAYHGATCRTDGDGTAQLPVPDSFSMAEEARLVICRRGAAPMQPTEYGGSVAFGLPPRPRGGVELGEVRLLEEPVLLAGIVVDGKGQPVPDLELTTQVSHFVSAQNLRIRGVGTVVGGTPFTHVARTDAAGRLTLREFLPADVPLQLRLVRDDVWQLPDQPAAKAGTADLRVVVARGAAIVVALPGAPKDGIVVRVERHGVANVSYPFQRLPDGMLRFPRLQPGTYDVRFLVQNEVICAVAGVEVRAGEDCTDPRLQAVPWRDKVRVVNVQVRDAKDQPVAPLITVRRMVDGQEQPFLVQCDKDGTASLALLAEAPGTLELSSPEHVTFRIPDPKGEISLRMQQRPRVRIVTPAGLSLPEGTLLQLGAGKVTADTVVRAGQETVLRPDSAGTMPLRLCVRPQKNEVQAVWTGAIDVAPTEGVQDKTLPIDQAVIDKLRALLPQKGP